MQVTFYDAEVKTKFCAKNIKRTHMNESINSYWLVKPDGHEQPLTHHDRSRSVTVSAVLNNANTIQYIIHFTWTHRGEEREHHKNST